MPTKPIARLTVSVPTKGRVRAGAPKGARLAFDATKQEARKKKRAATRKKGKRGPKK